MKITVSDHAVIRYLERVKGFDLEPFREEILRFVTPSVKMGATSVTKDGASYHVSCHQNGNFIVTTVISGADAKLHNGTYISKKRAENCRNG